MSGLLRRRFNASDGFPQNTARVEPISTKRDTIFLQMMLNAMVTSRSSRYSGQIGGRPPSTKISGQS
jgi:hypothetical protein